MYKVFVNEKRLTIGKLALEVEKNLHYDGTPTIEIAVDLLENTSCREVHIYGEHVEEIWANFKSIFKQVGAAGGIVENNNGEILFIYRLGRWDLPKGKIEKGESLEEAALREVNEETGLSHLLMGKFVNCTFHLYTERNGTKIMKTTNWFTMRYTGEKPPVPQVEEGITEASWKNREQIRADVFPNTFRNILLILREAGFGS